MRQNTEKREGSGPPCFILLFGDLSSSVRLDEELYRLLVEKKNPLLISFFDRVGDVVRRQIGHLPSEQQVLFPRFTTLIDLFSGWKQTEGKTVLKSFWLSVYQTAQVIQYFTAESQLLPSLENTLVIGPCAGGFTASAVSCSRNISDLVSNGVDAAIAAFKTALRSFLVARTVSLGQAARSGQSWSMTVSPPAQADIEGAVEAFHNSQLRAHTVWVGAVTPGHARTISGSPGALQQFLASCDAAQRHEFLDIESPYHAEHLFDEDDIEYCVTTDTEHNSQPKEPSHHGMRLLSSSTGEPVSTDSLGARLRNATQEALRLPLRWDLIATSCRAELEKMNAQSCTILPFASNAASMLAKALSKDSSAQVSIHDVASSHAIPIQTPARSFQDTKIAIVGYSGRFPSAESDAAFWELLRAGRDVHREIPPDRFDWRAHYDETGKRKNTSRIKHGCFIDEPGLFDARFFNISPKEAENTDPAQRLVLMTSYEAMEKAGMVRNRTPSTQQDRIGVFFGTTSDDWREVNSGQDVGTYFIPGGNRAFVPGRTSYFFGFSGPSLSIDTACSSSFAAIQAGCSYLWRGDVDTCIAGGTNVLTNPDNFAGLDRGHFLSTTGNCNAFDDGANGYCRSDAVGSVVLKRMDDAIADNDPIFGVIVGTNTNHCGSTDSITRPHEGDQASVFKRVMRYANVDPLDVGYIEMHGTGTQAGDATEMNSVLSTFVPGRQRSAEPKRPLYLGSAKANIGHAESASGVSSMIKVLLMMKHNEIPPHCGIKTKINHHYPTDLEQRGVRIARQVTPWRREDSATGKRAAFLNNFSAAGGNTAILIEDAPEQPEITVQDPRQHHIVTVTAKTPKSLLASLDSLIAFIESEGHSISLPALSYTTTARRMQHNHRVVVSGTDTEAVLSALRSRADAYRKAPDSITPIPRTKANIVFMFSGQGVIYNGLAKTLYGSDATFRRHLLRMDRLVRMQGFPSFIGLVDGTAQAESAGATVSQLAITCIQLALANLWQSWGIVPSAVVGHSLGEFAALSVAGVLSEADTIYLVGTRAAVLEKRCTPNSHTMLIVKGSRDVVRQLVERNQSVEWACSNQPSSQVVAGRTEDVRDVSRAAEGMGLETTPLEIPYAFHSIQIEPILAEFGQAARQNIVFHAPKIPIVSPHLARTVPAGDTDTLNASYLTAMSRGRVDFVGALTSAQKDGNLGFKISDSTIWLDIGVHPLCSGMVKGTLGSSAKTMATLRQGADDYKTLTASLEQLYSAGVPIDWDEYHRAFPGAHRVIPLPAYHWDLKNYWIQYRNSFCLTKGDESLATEQTAAEPATKRLSACAQQVLEESHGEKESTVVVQNDLFDEKLAPIIQGHVVNGAALCPSSLYADLGMTLGRYLATNSPNKIDLSTTGLEVNNVRSENPLIAKPNTSKLLFRAKAKADWSNNVANITVYSVDGNGKQTTTHAKLDVQFTAQNRWNEEWRRVLHLITARLDSLAEDVHNGKKDIHLIKRGMAYKLFSALVKYSPEYQGMSEVILDSKHLEAVTTVDFQVSQTDFYIDPRWIDSLGQVAGFIMNANDAVESSTHVFINHGWERMRIAEPFQPGKTYKAYNRMQEQNDTGRYAGDTYVLQDGKIVAVYEGVVFQKIPKRALDHMLPNAGAQRPAKVDAPARQQKASTGPSNQAKSTPSAGAVPSAPKPAAKKPAPKKASNDRFHRILELISQEVGVTTEELEAGCDFADIGVDSLLSLTITSKIREELDLELSPNLFVEKPTVSDLRAFIDDSDNSSDDDGSATPLSSSSSAEPQEGVESPASSVESTGVDEQSLKVTLVLREVIAEETGVATDELKPSSSLPDLGVDSLLGLNIASRVRTALDIDISSNDLLNCDTLQDVQDKICEELGISDATNGESAPVNSSQKSPPQPNADEAEQQKETKTTSNKSEAASNYPSATSVVLAGSLQTAESVLFLFPDGSGSASSYAAFATAFSQLPRAAIIGLNCPWRKTGAEMTRSGITMSTMVGQYMEEMIRILQLPDCKTRKVAVGGWSAGGILALEATRQFLERRSQIDVSVTHLVLLDSPNPVGLQNPPARMYDFFATLGIFGSNGKGIPTWLREHFDSFIRILDAYEPKALSKDDAPRCLIIYAREGVCQDPNGPQMEIREDDPREMKWLLNERTDFSADGWKSIVGEGQGKVAVEVVDGVNHFNLLDPGRGVDEVKKHISNFWAGKQ